MDGMLSRRKIVLSTCGSSGDLNPFIAIALELRARGYHPVIASQSEFGPRVEAEGLAFHPMRPGARDIEEELGLDHQGIVRRSIDARSGLDFLVRRVAMPFLRRSYQDMMSASEGASLVVTHTSAFGARLAAEKRGLPWVSAALAPFAFMSAYDPPALGIAPKLIDPCLRAGASVPPRARPRPGAGQPVVRGPVLALRHHRALFAGLRRAAAGLPLPHH